MSVAIGPEDGYKEGEVEDVTSEQEAEEVESLNARDSQPPLDHQFDDHGSALQPPPSIEEPAVTTAQQELHDDAQPQQLPEPNLE